MSLEAVDLTVTTRKRNNSAEYWAFFTKEACTFWHFVDRSRDDLKTQQSLPQHKETTGATGSPDTASSG